MMYLGNFKKKKSYHVTSGSRSPYFKFLVKLTFYDYINELITGQFGLEV